MGSLAESGMCRLCGWEHSDNQRIQDLEVSIHINSLNILNAKVSQLLQQNLNISFPSETTDLPSKICLDCKRSLQVTSEFLMKVREGQLFIQKLLGVQGSQTVLEKNIKIQLDLQDSPQQKKRGRPKKGFEKKRKKDLVSVDLEEPTPKRRKKPPKHLEEYVDIEKISKEEPLTADAAIDYEELKLNIDEDQDYRPPAMTDPKTKTGEGLNEHKCDLCDDTFTSEAQLQGHVQNTHGEFMYRCANPACELLVRSKTDLETHQAATGHEDIITLFIFQPSTINQVAEGSTEKDDDNVPDSLTSATTFTAKVVGVASDVVRLDGLDLPTLGKSDEDEVTFPTFEDPSLTFGSESVIISRNVIPGQQLNNPTHSDKGPKTLAGSESERTDHGCKPVSCHGCREDFGSQSEYLEHLNKVHRIKEPKSFACAACDKVFAAQSSLRYHNETVHTNVMHKCNAEGCGMEFRVKNLLYRHMKVHRNERPYVCTTCSKSFKALKNLRAHQQSHMPSDGLFCEVCGQTFKHASSLQMHIKLHAGEKNYACTFCNKRFAQSGNLKEHLRIHTGEKPFQCSSCSKSFTTSSQLRHHNLVHAAHKPHACVQCSKSFITPEALKVHTRRHTGEKPYACTKCKKRFIDSTGLRRHEQVHEEVKGLHICKICGKNYSDRSNLLKHTKTHKPGDEAKNTVWNIIRDVSASIEEGVEEDELQRVIYVAYEGDGPTDQTTIDLTVKDGQQVRLVAPLNIDPLTFAAEYLKDLQNIPVTE